MITISVRALHSWERKIKGPPFGPIWEDRDTRIYVTVG